MLMCLASGVAMRPGEPCSRDQVMSPFAIAGLLRAAATPGARLDPNQSLMRGATLAYTVALAIVAALSISVHVLLDDVIAQQRDSATLINVAGRQRMLSQRIALLASDLRAGDATALGPLAEAADLMERSNRAIGSGDDLGISNPPSPAGRAGFRGRDGLDAMISAFVAAARRVVAEPQGAGAETDVAALHKAARDTLLPALDASVGLFEREANGRVAWLRTIQTIVLVILLVTLVLEALFIFRPLVDRLRLHAGRLADLASRDFLTGLWNRRSFVEAAEREIGLARRSMKPLSIVVFDLDHFKSINDTHGHATGDTVLKRFAELLGENVRRTDIVGRIGGEEFAMIVPDATARAAAILAEKLRSAVAADAPSGSPRVTVSVGIAQVHPAEAAVDDALARADLALYEAKRSGRDRVVVA